MLPGLILNSWSQISIRSWGKLAVLLLFSSQRIFSTFQSLLSWQTWKTSFSWYLSISFFTEKIGETQKECSYVFTKKPLHWVFVIFLLRWMKLQSYLRPTTLLVLLILTFPSLLKVIVPAIFHPYFLLLQNLLYCIVPIVYKMI